LDHWGALEEDHDRCGGRFGQWLHELKREVGVIEDDTADADFLRSTRLSILASTRTPLNGQPIVSR